MTGVIKASSGIPAQHFGVSTKDFTNPSLINLFKHLCILSSGQLIPGYLFPYRAGVCHRFCRSVQRFTHDAARNASTNHLVLLEMQLTLAFRSPAAEQSPPSSEKPDRGGLWGVSPLSSPCHPPYRRVCVTISPCLRCSRGPLACPHSSLTSCL